MLITWLESDLSLMYVCGGVGGQGVKEYLKAKISLQGNTHFLHVAAAIYLHWPLESVYNF